MLVPFRGGNRPDQPTGAYDRVGQARGVKKIRARGYPQIKSVMGTGQVAKRVPHGYNKRVFNYPLFYGHEHGFDDTRTR